MAQAAGTWRGRLNLRDLIGGVLLLLVAGYFAASSLRNLALGTPGKMGPGFFPLMIAVALGGLALALMVRSLRLGSGELTFIAPRPLVCILAAPAVFAVTLGPLGFVPAMALTTATAACSSRQMTLRFAALLTVMLTVLCSVLFVWLLRMPVELFGPWFGF